MWGWKTEGGAVWTNNVCKKESVSIFILEDEFFSPKEYSMPGINIGT